MMKCKAVYVVTNHSFGDFPIAFTSSDDALYFQSKLGRRGLSDASSTKSQLCMLVEDADVFQHLIAQDKVVEEKKREVTKLINNITDATEKEYIEFIRQNND